MASMISSSAFTHRARRQQGPRISLSHAVAFLGGMIVATLSLTVFHGAILHSTQQLEHFADSHLQRTDTSSYVAKRTPEEGLASTVNDHHFSHGIASLDCKTHGGPDAANILQDLVYWKDLPLDSNYVSPMRSTKERQYLTFEPDGGGWNNIRMSMETVLAMAVAMGRVLVLPPSQKMYLLGRKSLSFADFFPLKEIAMEHAGLEIISMKQFLEETNGKIRVESTHQIAFPPGGRTDWDGDTEGVRTKLNPWFQTIAPNPDWNPDTCVAAFPKSTDPEDAAEMQRIFDHVKETMPKVEGFVNHPTPVNATVEERMREFIATRKELCLYDMELQNAQVIHFNGKRNQAGRLLVHFYAFLFFQDYRSDLWMKRFVRDHVRYVDDVQCAAARVIEAVTQHSKYHGNGGLYDAFHIRRGDFQYKKTRVEATEILEAAKDQIPQGATVYVGTDERRKDFFKPMAEYWDLLFLDDFLGLLEGIETNYYGMIDQLVTSRGRIFFGCWFSTFTSYITRVRGYHSQIEQREGYEMGRLPDTFYYALPEHKTKMHDYWPVKKLFYAREFPAAWRNIDFDAA